MSNKPFQFKEFTIQQNKTAMKVGTDGVLLGAWCNSEKASTILDIASLASRRSDVEVNPSRGRLSSFSFDDEHHYISIYC